MLGPDVAESGYERVHWVFWRLLGAIYCIAFLSLAIQITGLIGSKGILPLNLFLTRISEALAAGRYWHFPTIFWLNSSDLALTLVCCAGALFGALIMAGIWQRAALVVCYIFYLSLVTAGQDFLAFQWDTLLLEAGFLAIFLGYSRVIIWLFRWLLFRLMLLSGAVKLLSHDSTWRSLTALQFHYQTQPLPTPIAWYAQQLPAWFQEFSVLVMFTIELGMPFLIFGPRRVRFFAGACIVFLQVMILLTGNYGFFNLLALALCVPLLDDAALSRIAPRTNKRKLVPLKRYVALAVAALLLLLSGSQLIGEFAGVTPASALWMLRLFSPLNLTNTYGLFAVMTTVRTEITIQGSNDGMEWRTYDFKYKPGDADRAPPWVAPYQPRLDWQMWFAALGTYRNNPWFVNFIFRLLEGSPDVLALLRQNPFPGAPPRYIRALASDYSFTDWQTRREIGAWWNRQPKGTYLPAVSLRDFRPAGE